MVDAVDYRRSDCVLHQDAVSLRPEAMHVLPSGAVCKASAVSCTYGLGSLPRA